MIRVELEHGYRAAVEPTRRVCEVASMFGLGVDESREVKVLPCVTLGLEAGRVLFVTGASGGGKSTLLRLLGERLSGVCEVLDFGALGEGEDGEAIVEAVGGTLGDAVRWLSLAGLNDAFVMLRGVGELSDGQRYRYRLARAMAACERGGGGLTVVLADEFGATLDRQTAKVVSRNVRKWVSGMDGEGGVCFVAATSHDDLLESLEPDVLVWQKPGGGMEVMERGGDGVG